MIALGLGLAMPAIAQTQNDDAARQPKEKPIPYVDNNRYWIRMAEKGLATLNPEVRVEPATYTGSAIMASGTIDDSPDVPIFSETDMTQSEVSIMVDPNNTEFLLNSNNSTPMPVSEVSGANYAISEDASETWTGQMEGAGGKNSGDPAVGIDLMGRKYVGYIHDGRGQGASFTDDNGQTWTNRLICEAEGGGLLDKNHLWVDASPTSPYKNYVYSAWTPLSGSSAHEEEIVLSRSTDRGESWDDPVMITGNINAGSHCQGVNIQTGADGKVYATYAIYDVWSGSNTYEDAIGLSISEDGGATWDGGTRIIENIRGARNYDNLGKDMRINSFPVMAVDISGGEYNDNIYICWANVGVPGVNDGPGVHIFIIKSTDGGATWSDPIKVNTDPIEDNARHYLPWICCDFETGVVSAIFYDDRNVGGSQVEVFCSNSFDGGETWEDFKVSDVAFTPAPIPGLAGGYMGDYLGITARGGRVYPIWMDNRDGHVMAYCSPYILSTKTKPTDLEAVLNFDQAQVDLNWEFEGAEGFEHFVIKRNNVEIATTTDKTYTDNLPEYGKHTYKVSAKYDDGENSIAAMASVQYGMPKIAVTPELMNETMDINQVKTKQIVVSNPGELPLDYTFSYAVPEGRLEYCDASGGGEEHIINVTFGDFSNDSGEDGYTYYDELATEMESGMSLPMSVTVANNYSADHVVVFVDWNIDGEFTDDEMVELETSKEDVTYTGNIVCPEDAGMGESRMRVRCYYSSYPGPCDETTYGEVEDYPINLKSWIKIEDMVGSLAAGETKTHDVILMTEGVDVGSYQKVLAFSSNAMEQEEPSVEINLEVVADAFPAEATADIDKFCSEADVQLDVDVEDAANCTFVWTSDPAGFSSTQKNPTATIDETTTFSVAVTKSGITVNASVLVTKSPEPTLEVGEDIEVCTTAIAEIEASATGEGLTYQWSTGENTPSIEVIYDEAVVGEDMIQPVVCTVTNADGCTAEDDMEIQWKDCTGINEITTNAFRIYPNPANTKVRLAIFAQFSQEVSVRLYDIHGRCMLNKENLDPRESKVYDISNLEGGIYTFVVVGEGKIAQEKLVINR